MPTSGWRKTMQVMGVLDKIPIPSSVLDVGVGFGRYGAMLREELDIRKRRYPRDKWVTTIDGVEVWEEYISPLHRYVYNKLYIGDIGTLVATLGVYDLILLTDVVEHMTREQGAKVLLSLFDAHCRHGMVVTYPTIIGNEHVHWQNPYEQHLHVWTQEQMLSLFSDRPCKVLFNTPQCAYIVRKE